MVKAFTGGDKLQARLADLADRIGRGKAVRVGFLEGSTYPDGTPLPVVAATQEFGGTVQVPEHQVDVYRKLAKDGDFLREGRFVKRSQSNFQTTHAVPAHSVTIPARPFMRPAIADNSGGWGADLASLLQASGYDAGKALAQMGEVIAGQIRASIIAVTEPPLAPSTVARKGSDKPLVETGHMLNSVDYEVEP